MKIVSIKTVKLNNSVPVYDIINSYPYHNFLVKTGTKYIVSHNCAMLDEMDFAKGQDATLEKSSVMKLYTSVKRRIESRFMKNGKVPGLMFLVSSKNSVNDFLETYINRNRYNPRLMIIDEPLWVVKSTVNNYCGKTFKVAVGNRYYSSRILNDSEDANAIAKQQRVIEVPIEHREAFELSINSALADIAGVAIVSSSKFFSMTKVLETYRDYLHNPFRCEVIRLGFSDNSSLRDYIDEDKLPMLERGSLNYHIHWDTSKNGDRSGLSMTTTYDKKKVSRLVNGNILDVYDKVHRLVFAVAIEACPGEEIPFYKVRDFIYWLRDIGFNIATITCDSFQCLPGYTKIFIYDKSKGIFITKELYKLDSRTDEVFSLVNDKVSLVKFTNLRSTKITKKLYRIKTYEGQEILCTDNHPILTNNGYKRADSIKVLDRLVYKRSDMLKISRELLGL